MGSIYRPKYKNKTGELVEVSVWWLKYRANGRLVRESTEPKTTKETVARGQLRLKEGDAERGVMVPQKVNRKTVDEILAGVVQDYRINNLRSIGKLEDRIRLHLVPFFGGRNAAGVSDDLVRDFIVKRQADEASNAEINRELSALGRAYSLARKTVTVRPSIPKLKEAAPRSGFFEDEQFEAVCRHLPPLLVSAFRFAHITGWRIHSEVLALPWRLVDFQAREVRLEAGTTKNDEARIFPFSEALAAILTAQRAYTDDVQRRRNMIVPWVFHRNGRRIKDFYGGWDKACEKAGCPGRIAHDLRRTAVRNLVRAGVDTEVAMKLTGHKTREVFSRYNITSARDLRDAVERLDLAVGKVLGKVGTIQTENAANESRN
jgi:integrase